MEVQGSQPEKRVMAISMVAIFMVLGFMLFGVAYVVSQSFAYRYTGDSALLTPSLVLGSALLARGVFHLVVPLAHFGNQSLYLRPSPLMGCRKIDYELIEDFTFDKKTLVIKYRDAGNGEGESRQTTLKRHQVTQRALDDITFELNQRVRS